MFTSFKYYLLDLINLVNDKRSNHFIIRHTREPTIHTCTMQFQIRCSIFNTVQHHVAAVHLNIWPHLVEQGVDLLIDSAHESSIRRNEAVAQCVIYCVSMSAPRKIENYAELAVTSAREHALSLVEAGLAAIDTRAVIRNTVSVEGGVLHINEQTYQLDMYENIYVLGVGKCSLDAAEALEDVLGTRIEGGALLDVRDGGSLKRIRPCKGTHPYPSEENIDFTKALLEFAENAGERDLVLMLVSGGGSTLLCQPDSHTCQNEANLVQHLFHRGTTIRELNIVRKHLSKARGGYVAAAAHPATLVSLIFSDVPGDDITTIASGPTVLDTSTLAEAKEILRRYDAASCGFSEDHLFETPKDGALFANVKNELVLTNKIALDAMLEAAHERGLVPEICDTGIEGEARDVAHRVVSELHTRKRGSVLLYGGETTVTIKGNGKGGRNEELSLAALRELEDDELLIAFASDGRDNTDFAGGIADALTKERAAQQGLILNEYLENNDSYTFFHTLEQGVRTGYTGSNVADIVVALKI